MDIFVEQLLQERRGVRYFLAVFGLTLAALLLLTVAVLFLIAIPMMFGLAVCGIGYGWFWTTRMLITEYEYSVTNGDIDIDRIRGRSRRLRLVSVRGEKIESFAPHTVGEDLSRFDRVVRCHSGEQDAVLWRFTYHSKKNGHTVVVFQPDNRVLAALVDGLPYLLQREVRAQHEIPALSDQSK